MGQNIDQFWIEHETFHSSTGSFATSYIWKSSAIKDKNDICGTICMQSHSSKSWDWLVSNQYEKLLTSDLLREIGRTIIMSNMVRGHVCRVNRLRSRIYSMARQRCTKIPLWEHGVSKNLPIWWLTWVLITLCVMIGILAIPGYSMPGPRIRGQTSLEHNIRVTINALFRNTII